MMVLSLLKSSIASPISLSFSLSTAAIASSNIKIGAFFSIILAIEILCFSPPDNLTPISPIRVSYPFGKAEIKSWHLTFLAASMTSSFVALCFPIAILSKILKSNRMTSCPTLPIRFEIFS